MLVRGTEDEELAPEAAGEGEADEPEHERPHRDTEQRTLPPHAGEVVQRHRLAELALARGDDCERAERHGRVRHQVVEERLPAGRVVRGDRDQHEACVRDRRVGEESLHVSLDQRGEVPDRERDARDERDRDRPQVALVRKGGDEDAQH